MQNNILCVIKYEISKEFMPPSAVFYRRPQKINFVNFLGSPV